MAFVEIGATGVGKIVQSHDYDELFHRGEEKGYFLFGGSSVIIFGEPGAFKFDHDLIEKTQAGMETLVRLGETIGSKSM